MTAETRWVSGVISARGSVRAAALVQLYILDAELAQALEHREVKLAARDAVAAGSGDRHVDGYVGVALRQRQDRGPQQLAGLGCRHPTDVDAQGRERRLAIRRRRAASRCLVVGIWRRRRPHR